MSEELCGCASEKDYEKYLEGIAEKVKSYQAEGHIVPSRDMIKTPAQIEKIRKACDLNNLVLDTIAKKIKKGMTTDELNEIVYDVTVKNGGIPAPLNYQGFPKSVCISINDQVCHGIPDGRVLKNGDIVNVDVSTIVDGYYGDASRMFEIGRVNKEAKDLVAITKECLRLGVEAVKPWGFLGDIGAVIQKMASKHGYSVVEMFGGHGVGLEFHEDPFVAHIGQAGTGMLLVPGMIFTIEPMLNTGTSEVFIDADNDWTVYTEDGGLSAQWEHTVLVTDDGVEILAH